MHLLDGQMLWWMWSVPLLGLLYLYGRWQRRRSLLQFASVLTQVHVSQRHARRLWKGGLVLIALTLLIFAAARPSWNPVQKEVHRQGRDVVFVLDVSRSMLAEDLRPSRLERAKLAIQDCADALEGDRVGLVVFAGDGAIRCPLTLDYGFFRMMLENVSVESVRRGGTLIGDALRLTGEKVFDRQARAFKDVILITDGEDHDSFPVDAAADLGRDGIRLIAIGIGDESKGRPIPVTDGSGARSYMEYEGRMIRSRLDADTLRNMVRQTPGGRYLNVATGSIELDKVYRRLVRSAEKKTLETTTIQRYEEKFQIFAALGLLVLMIEMCLGERS